MSELKEVRDDLLHSVKRMEEVEKTWLAREAELCRRLDEAEERAERLNTLCEELKYQLERLSI